jgi:hypothetical protein
VTGLPDGKVIAVVVVIVLATIGAVLAALIGG